ncbi:cupin domain-containing protein [Micromonospora haikouensis]|uniref:cupin domain-containing protein n=1 Tax=Micromonospora haikouensis TaxID=686309 RepID=UPI003D736F35
MEPLSSRPDRSDPIWTAANGFVVRDTEGAVKLINGGQEIMRVKVTGSQTDGRLSLMEGRIAPGFGNTPHAHGAEDEAFYVVSGEFRFINGDRSFIAGPGDFVYIPRGTRHGFKNLGTEEAKLLVFYTPAGAEQFFLQHGEDPDPSGKLPPVWTAEKFAALGESLDAHQMILLPDGDDWA